MNDRMGRSHPEQPQPPPGGHTVCSFRTQQDAVPHHPTNRTTRSPPPRSPTNRDQDSPTCVSSHQNSDELASVSAIEQPPPRPKPGVRLPWPPTTTVDSGNAP